jgi:hypothetical protein
MGLADSADHTGAQAFSLHRRCQHTRPVRPSTEPEPHHTHRSPAPECADLAHLQLETGECQAGKTVGDFFDHPSIDAADKADCEVEVRGRRPPEVRCRPGAKGDESSQLIALRLGHRQPEKRSNSQRAGVFQCSRAHVLGRVGRQP